MNRLNSILFAIFKVSLYLLVVLGVLGVLTMTLLIPRWVRTEEVVVPNITGEPYYEAVRILEEAGLQPAETIQEASSDAPKGEVVSQKPDANFRIKSYQPVEITVSIGAELVPVPSVIGKSQAEAIETLEAAGFSTGRIAAVHSTTYQQENTVIAQTPREGGGQRRGSAVSLLVSQGSKPQAFQLPNLRSRDADEVSTVLEKAGFTITPEYNSHPRIPVGMIITHEPPTGAMVKTGDSIRLVISGVPDATPNKSKILRFKHPVRGDGTRSRRVKIVIRDEHNEQTVVDQDYAPGTVIDLEKQGVRVFGKARVSVYENGEKLPEVVIH